MCEHTPSGFRLSQSIERKVMGREPSGRSRLRLFSKAPLAEVLKEEEEEPLGETPWGLPFERLKKKPLRKGVHRLYLSYIMARGSF